MATVHRGRVQRKRSSGDGVDVCTTPRHDDPLPSPPTGVATKDLSTHRARQREIYKTRAMNNIKGENYEENGTRSSEKRRHTAVVAVVVVAVTVVGAELVPALPHEMPVCP